MPRLTMARTPAIPTMDDSIRISAILNVLHARQPVFDVNLRAGNFKRGCPGPFKTEWKSTDLQRESISLAYYQGYTYAEVATMLDANPATVKTRMRDGLVRLRDCMGVEA